MSLIEKAIAHFSAKEIRSFYIKEWDETVYAKNLTLQDKASWLKKAGNDTHEYMLYAVIHGLTDKEGKPVWDLGDKVTLSRAVDPDIVGELASFVLNSAGATDEEREKN